jgi:hypothetical protein
MKTECTAEQLEFHGLGRRVVVGEFDTSHQSRKPGLPWSSDTLNSFNRFMACLLTKIRCAAEAVRNAG